MIAKARNHIDELYKFRGLSEHHIMAKVSRLTADNRHIYPEYDREFAPLSVRVLFACARAFAVRAQTGSVSSRTATTR